jgi:uncharacterized protein YvpB
MRVPSLAAIVLLGILSTLLQPIPVKADALPEEVYIRGVEGHAQSLFLSCESRSAADWAAFWDVDIRERKFLAQLPRSQNPDKGFVGRPSDPWGNIPPDSYGVHAGPVAALLREYGLEAEARQGMKWDELRAEIAAGRPAIVWVIGQVWRGVPIRYKLKDGVRTTVARFEHTMILIGYSPSHVYLVDAYSGEEQKHSLRTFLRSWDTLGNMAVVGQAKPKEFPPPEITHQSYLPALAGASNTAGSPPPPPPSPEADQIYTVQRGDSLIDIARRFNVTWRKLAEFNHLEPPYTIFPGQKLKIP